MLKKTLKKNISTIPSALDKVNQMRGVQFKWKKEHDAYDENHQYYQRVNIGFIAEELEAVVEKFTDIVNLRIAAKKLETLGLGRCKNVPILENFIVRKSWKISLFLVCVAPSRDSSIDAGKV